MCTWSRRRKLAALTLSMLYIFFSFSACSKDAAISALNRVVERAGQIAVTSEKRLRGERKEGSDSYTGTYTADYTGYSETEFPFGGTSIKPRDNGDTITISCKINIISGTVAVFCTTAGEEIPLAGENGTFIRTLILPLGSNYIGVRGSDFTGTIELHVM